MKENRLSVEEFEARFQTEEDCADYLYQVKWPQGFRCPRCGHNHAYPLTKRRLPLFECANCHYQASLTVGTVMEGSHTALRKWFLSFFLISSPCGINATQLNEKNRWGLSNRLYDSAKNPSCHERRRRIEPADWKCLCKPCSIQSGEW